MLFRSIISQQFVFVEVGEDGRVADAGEAPYLDYRAPTDAEKEAMAPLLEADWLKSDLDKRIMDHAVSELVPQQLERVRAHRTERVDRIRAQVERRLSNEINFWDARANDLRMLERAGNPQRLNAANAEERARDLTDRLEVRMAQLEREARVSALAPEIKGAALVVPQSLLAGLMSQSANRDRAPARVTEEVREARERIELAAMDAVMRQERAMGHDPEDVSDVMGLVALQGPRSVEILSRLTTGEATINDLVDRFHLTQPTISRHVQTLERAGLVERRREGQSRPVALKPDALKELDDWLEPFRAFWGASLSNLEAYAKEVADADRNDDPNL